MAVVPIRSDGVVPAVVSPPDEGLIAKIEEFLADAKSGQLRAIGFVKIDRDRAICHGWVGHADHHDMTAGVNLLAFRYMYCGQVNEDG
jgi:hypothetical protein